MPNWRRYAGRHARYSAGMHYKGVGYSSGCLLPVLSIILISISIVVEIIFII